MNKIQFISKQVIALQIDALKKLQKKIDYKEFNKAVKSISSCKSKVIICGVGKSGLIAKKISATFSSVGCPSFTLSANDSSHGDLGSISKDDILILISYSGKSEELKNIIKYAKRNFIKIISIVSNQNSFLYKFSDIKLLLPHVKEAGFDIVPTSSTTTQLCIGDALAIASMQYRNFKKSQFKEFHPAGNIGKKLITVEDLMIKNDKIQYIYKEMLFSNISKKTTKKNLGIILICNSKNEVLGICTDGDIKRAIKKYKDLSKIKMKQIMTSNPLKVHKDLLASEALRIMNEKKITHLLIKDNKKKISGIVHIHDILDAKIDES